MKKTFFLLLALLFSTTFAQAYNGWGFFASYWNTSDAGDAVGAGAKVAIEMIPGELDVLTQQGQHTAVFGKNRGASLLNRIIGHYNYQLL